jgi:sugar/nucleoside kinase (ribokinase family)
MKPDDIVTGRRVVVLGGASWNTMIYLDRFPEPRPATIANARHHVAAGSTGTGKALALKALGIDPLLHATIGDDREGDSIRALFAERGIATRFDIDPGGTSRHVNVMDGEGRRISIFLFNGSPDSPVGTAQMAEAIAEADTIFLNITPSSVPLLPLVAQSDAEVWVDLHDYDGQSEWHRQFIALADVLQFSDEAHADPRPQMRRLAETARLVICTRGTRGALALDEHGREWEQAALPAELKDSNGAGDCYMVGLWYALRSGNTLPEALRFAAAAAAMAVETLELAPVAMTPEAVAARAST